ncbi:MAG TPA: hypothetical protein VGM88_26910 [Kofleriaceae bacterium]
MTGDPYRTAATNACPQCGEPLDLAVTTAPIPCATGCGKWWPRAYLTKIVDLDQLGLASAAPGYQRETTGSHWWKGGAKAAPCPSCERELVLAWLETVPVRQCEEHGVWVTAASDGRFDMQLVAPKEHYQRIVAVIELLAANDPRARLELARRIVALEEQVAMLLKGVETPS